MSSAGLVGPVHLNHTALSPRNNSGQEEYKTFISRNYKKYKVTNSAVKVLSGAW